MDRYNVYYERQLIAVVHGRSGTEAINIARSKLSGWYDHARCVVSLAHIARQGPESVGTAGRTDRNTILAECSRTPA